jgi:hypothetical protein
MLELTLVNNHFCYICQHTYLDCTRKANQTLWRGIFCSAVMTGCCNGRHLLGMTSKGSHLILKCDAPLACLHIYLFSGAETVLVRRIL